MMRVTRSIRKWQVWLLVFSAVIICQLAYDAKGTELTEDQVRDLTPAVKAQAGVDSENTEASSETCQKIVPITYTKASEPSEEDAVEVKPIQTLIFQDEATVRDALRLLGMKYRKNIVPSSNVQGKLNVNAIYDVTFDEALDAILGYEYRYEKEGNFVKVYTKEEYETVRTDFSRMECKIFRLYYIPSEEAAGLISPVLSSSAVMTISSMPETGLSSGDAVEVDEGGTSLSQFDTLVIKDYPENLEMVANLLSELDRRPIQVLVEATILSATLTEGLELGVDINALNGSTISGVSTIAAGLPGAMFETAGFTGTESGSAMRVGVSSGPVSAFITALESVTDTTVLANPKILALNKQVGTVFIGQKLGYKTSTSIIAEGVATEGEVKFLDSGTKLSFRPYVGNDGYIRMDIYPKDSSAKLNDEGVPTETTAELATNIMVKDGQTIVIGGMFRDDVTTSRSQIPLLGDLPLIGPLFRSTVDSSGRQEVIVLLTCHIIEKSSEIQGDQRREDISRKRFGSIDGLQPIGVAKIVEDGYAKAVKLYSQKDFANALVELNKVLKLRPTYIEAIRLKEKILVNTDCLSYKDLNRIAVEEVESADSHLMLRR